MKYAKRVVDVLKASLLVNYCPYHRLNAAPFRKPEKCSVSPRWDWQDIQVRECTFAIFSCILTITQLFLQAASCGKSFFNRFRI